MGFQSYAFRWFFGYSATGGSGPLPPVDPTLCVCPTYKRDGTLTNTFKLNETLTDEFTKDQTLTNQWRKRNCNG